MRDRWLGLLLFLPVPTVLFLFTQAPLGVPLSLALGVALMATHRLYARPFALSRADRRCLWCGAAVAAGPELVIEEPLGTTRWRACSEAHAQRVHRFVNWAGAHRALVQVGILGTLAVFLVAAVLTELGLAGPLRYADPLNFFRLGIGLTVLPLSLPGLRRGAGERALRAPFPVHIQALIGTAAVVWLFRIVGAVWVTLAALYFARRP